MFIGKCKNRKFLDASRRKVNSRDKNNKRDRGAPRVGFLGVQPKIENFARRLRLRAEIPISNNSRDFYKRDRGASKPENLIAVTKKISVTGVPSEPKP